MDSDLVDKWLGASSQRERAQIEHDIWQRDGMKTGEQKRDYFQKLLGGRGTEYEIRATIFNAGEASDPLWQRIDSKQLSEYMAKRILAIIREHRPAEKSLSEWVREALAHYDAQDIWRYEDGVPLRSTIVLARTLQTVAHASMPQTAPEAPKETEGLEWKTLRQTINTFFESRLSENGGSLPENERLIADIRADVDVLLKDMRNKLSRHRTKYTLLSASNDEARAIEACENLHIDWPGIKHVDAEFLKRAKLQRKILAREYHSDTGGRTADPVKLTTVIESYEALTQFVKEK